MSTVAFQQPVPFQFAKIVAKPVQPVAFRGKLKSGEDGFMDVFGGPTADGIAAMQQDFQ